MYDKIRKTLKDLWNKHKRGMFNILKAKSNKDIFDGIYSLTEDICRGKQINFNTRCYLIFHGFKDFPKCENPNCSNLIIENINSFSTGFHRYCSTKCLSSDKKTKRKIAKTKTERYGYPAFNNYEKTKKTNIERYGVEHTFQTENNKSKAKETKLERYGDENYINIEKRNETNIERYGCICPVNNEEIHKKRDVTMIERYGVLNCLESEELRKKMEDTCERMYGDRYYHNMELSKKTKMERYGDENYNNREQNRETCLERYGVTSFSQTGEFVKKINETCNEKYGTDWYMSTDDFKIKSRETCFEKYGCSNFSKSDEFRKIMTERHRTEFYDFLCGCDNVIPCFTFDEYCENQKDRSHQYKWKCNRCETEFYSHIDFDFSNYYNVKEHARCPKCDVKLKCKSDGEIKLVEYIKTIYSGRVISGRGTRKIIYPKEIDIYIPDMKMGIEYDGLYWHSEYNGVTKEKMIEKTLLCEENGIRLIRITSDEWNHDNDNVREKIRMIISNEEYDIAKLVYEDNGTSVVIRSNDKIVGRYCYVVENNVATIYDILFESGLFVDELFKHISELYHDVEFIFDRKIYPMYMIQNIFSDIEYIEQKKIKVDLSNDRILRDDEYSKFYSYIWDCGYFICKSKNIL